MKRIPVWICLLAAAVMSGCSFNLPTLPQQGGGGIKATENIKATDDTVQTQVAKMLTTMPTNTPSQPAATATKELATLAVSTPAPTDTAAPTATEAPAATSTATKAPATATPAATATQSRAPAQSTATLSAGDPRSKLGAPTATDPMDDSTTFIWPTGSDPFTNGDFSDGKMVVTSLSFQDGWRMANPTGEEFKNIYLEATFITKACTGADHYGLMARVPVLQTPDQGYMFGFTCDGRYSLRRWDGLVGAKGEMTFLVDWTASSAINAGSNQTNRMGLMLVNNRILLYANGVFLKEVSDSHLASGFFGVFLGPDPSLKTKNYTILVDQMSYWLNPTP